MWSQTISAKTPLGMSALCVTLWPEKDAACEQHATVTGVHGPTHLVSYMDNDSHHTLHILHFSLMQTLCQQSTVDRMDLRVWRGWLNVSMHQLIREACAMLTVLTLNAQHICFLLQWYEIVGWP